MALVIAELCQNHNGDRKLLQEMVWAAAEAGADYAKLQAIFAEDLAYREQFENGSIEDGVVRVIKRPYQSEYDRLRKLEISYDEYGWFNLECGRAGIKPLVTVFTRALVPKVAKYGWRDVKVASYDCASYPLLRELRRCFTHLFVSTGATYDQEIEEAARVLKGVSFTFFHCVTIYPTPLEEVNLARLEYLREFTPSVGFSDHTAAAEHGIKAAAAALYLGADVVERHFTLLPRDQTKDGPVSIDARQLKELARLAHGDREVVRRYVETEVGDYAFMMGRKNRALSHVELLNREYYRGRFASRAADGSVVYNWEERAL